jgi:hypothetical protein
MRTNERIEHKQDSIKMQSVDHVVGFCEHVNNFDCIKGGTFSLIASQKLVL